MKLCVIGNSHAAMILAAHHETPIASEVTLFGKPSLSAHEVALDGSVIRAVTPEMVARLEAFRTPPELDLDTFDAVVIAGLAPSVFAAVRVSQAHSVSGWPSGQTRVATALTATTPLRRPLMTRQVFRATLTALTRESLACELASALRAASSIPVFFVPQPYPSAQLLEVDGKYPVFKRLVADGDGAALAEDLDHAHGLGLDCIAGVNRVGQPHDSMVHGCLSHTDYMRGAPRLSLTAEQAPGDVLHANARLGHHVLNSIQSVMKA